MREGSYALSPDRGQNGRVWQLESGRWKADYREGGRGAARPCRTFDSKAEAASWLRGRLDALAERRASAGDDVAARVRKREESLTVDVAVERFLVAHEADRVTIEKLRRQLKPLQDEFGSRLVAGIEPYELQAWRKTVSEGWRHDVFRAAKQAFAQWRAWHWIEVSPAAEVKNPRPKRKEPTIPPWEHVVAISEEIDERYMELPIIVCGLGLRPEEWIALDRARDLDLVQRRVYVREAHSQGRLIELGPDGSKSWRQRRYVPARQVVLAALGRMVPRIDSTLLFPAPKGGYLDLEKFRSRTWAPALKAAGVPYFPPGYMRHVYASECLASGIGLFSLSRRMGTSLKEIDEHYGHLVADADEMELRMLDAHDAARQGAS